MFLAIVISCVAPERVAVPAGVDRLPPRSLASVDLPFEPIPRSLEVDEGRRHLGERLFHDPRLSGTGDRACSDCHVLDQGGVKPGEARSNHPLDNPTGTYNVPTVFNVGFNFRYNWNGRFRTLEDHLSGPMMSPIVMDAGSWAALLQRLRPAYHDDFVAAGYPAVDEASVKDAMATYQRSLLTPDSDFDRFLRGEAALPERAQAGFELFQSLGCSSCHQGINLGGNLFQKFGVLGDPFRGRKETVEADYGRMLVTGDKADAFVFRVPSLRNVAQTAPYFHDGSAATLDEAVEVMARVQLGFELSDEEIGDLVAFLETLTGVYEVSR